MLQSPLPAAGPLGSQRSLTASNRDSQPSQTAEWASRKALEPVSPSFASRPAEGASRIASGSLGPWGLAARSVASHPAAEPHGMQRNLAVGNGA